MSNLLNLLEVRSLILSDDDEIAKLSDNLESIYNNINTQKIKIPMILSRRLSQGAKLAIELSNTFLKDNIDALVFSSRHGELDRSGKILKAIAENLDVSPTDFTMSVHNNCPSQFLISSKLRLPYSSIASGYNTFIQGLYETLNFIMFGYKKVLYVDFDSVLPSFYEERLKDIKSISYANAFLFEANGSFDIEKVKGELSLIDGNLPLSLKFLSLYKKNK